MRQGDSGNGPPVTSAQGVVVYLVMAARTASLRSGGDEVALNRIFSLATGVRAGFACSLGVLLMICTLQANAQTRIVQGQLQLQWGDPRGAGQLKRPGKFLATLITDDGGRLVLDPGQAKAAAGDLHALANRRVAVGFANVPRSGGQGRIEAIVPADNLGQRYDAAVPLKAGPVAKAVVGTTRWVTVACKFSDIATEQKTVEFFRGQYGAVPGQLGHYWPEVSYGKVSLAGSDAYGWFTLPQPRSHYVTGEGDSDADLDKLFEDCAAAADPTVNFTGVQGINMMFNGDLDGYAWGGSACGPLEGVANRCIRNTWNPPWSFNNLAPLAHEMGHGYGLPHSDNSDGDDDPYDNPWDVMSDSWRNAVGNATYGSLPKHINIYQRDRLGWVDPARKLTLAAGGPRVTVNLDAASLSDSVNTQMVVFTVPQEPGVLYTLEARKRGGSYEANLAGNAVIIHRVVNGGMAYSVDATTPPANVANNEGSMFKAGETWVSPYSAYWVKVESESATGFVVSLGPKPRFMGGPAPIRQGNGGATASQPAMMRSEEPASRKPVQTAPCGTGQGGFLARWRCNQLLQ
jgi:gametolysin peptidase M11